MPLCYFLKIHDFPVLKKYFKILQFVAMTSPCTVYFKLHEMLLAYLCLGHVKTQTANCRLCRLCRLVVFFLFCFVFLSEL